jgi:hypothetical protein
MTPLEPRRYAVSFTSLKGDRRTVLVITDRGPHKAVFLASATAKSVVAKPALLVDVDDAGPVELDADGVAILSGHLIDRQEW